MGSKTPITRRRSRSSYLSWTSAFRASVPSSEDQPAPREGTGWCKSYI